MQQVKQRHAIRWPEIDRLIVSNEMYSSSSRLSDRPITKVLAILKEDLWPTGQIKVIIVLRNQAARLASQYVQNSNLNWNAGQKDFEKTVEKTLNTARMRRLLDYSRWIDGLGSVLGRENLCVLLLEESNTVEFWQQLKDFCHLEKLDPLAMTSPEVRANARSKSAKVWTIRQPDAASRAAVVVDRWMNLAWPQEFQPKKRQTIRRHAIEKLQRRCQPLLDQSRRENRERNQSQSRYSSDAQVALRSCQRTFSGTTGP